ncbi:MAG: hypothetical protein OEW11_11170 [Nitrospirota bacterium]|nr:hypothetical protein [Nitrospirota bacterium]
MLPLATAMLTLGPAVLRGVGAMVGGKAAIAATDGVAGLLEQAAGLPHGPALTLVSEALGKVSPAELEVLAQVVTRAQEMQAQVRQDEIAAGVARDHDDQETRRSETDSTDRLIRRTRPLLARWSFFAAVVYVIALEMVLPVVVWLRTGVVPPGLPEAQWEITGLLYAPCLAYIGGRSLEAFSAWGKSAGAAGMAGRMAAGVAGVLFGRKGK